MSGQRANVHILTEPSATGPYGPSSRAGKSRPPTATRSNARCRRPSPGGSSAQNAETQDRQICAGRPGAWSIDPRLFREFGNGSSTTKRRAHEDLPSLTPIHRGGRGPRVAVLPPMVSGEQHPICPLDQGTHTNPIGAFLTGTGPGHEHVLLGGRYTRTGMPPQGRPPLGTRERPLQHHRAAVTAGQSQTDQRDQAHPSQPGSMIRTRPPRRRRGIRHASSVATGAVTAPGRHDAGPHGNPLAPQPLVNPTCILPRAAHIPLAPSDRPACGRPSAKGRSVFCSRLVAMLSCRPPVGLSSRIDSERDRQSGWVL
jgi:hypothetical protein